ncbi:endo-1,4-beta-xylanase xylA, putative (macronuclear) [Tetrahymena thermophila SB210]|uniref:Endo-1,4-beta-xylanase xylA, putative n=1 Tax=Tetrahymena thermophila (strain SB210) TaxID=312017 RepID=W7XK63_TETTS|nr:endo-1,4-beta-xylanase xylA, putative [Tetrahymena thermophila SB210]EWS74629.1 endo-1,4-beta-xylanase xylA, putative [Tetrahymena thermophila SB210]|eukprot:XP_012652851.1 endo-1,4-beta-xylanase xylA, putative [Tetrahymena thermophila SB210]
MIENNGHQRDLGYYEQNQQASYSNKMKAQEYQAANQNGYTQVMQRQQFNNQHDKNFTQDLIIEIEKELEYQQKMLIEDDFSHKNWQNVSQQGIQQNKKENILHISQGNLSGDHTNNSTQVYTPSIKFYDQLDNQIQRQEIQNDHFYQSQFMNGFNSKNQQIKQDRTNPNTQSATNSFGNIQNSFNDSNSNKVQVEQKDNKETDNKLFSNFFIDSVQANINQDYFQQQQKNLYFQSVNNQQEAIKSLLTQIQKKESPIKAAFKTKQPQQLNQIPEDSQGEKPYNLQQIYQNKDNNYIEENLWKANKVNQLQAINENQKLSMKIPFGQKEIEDKDQVENQREFNQEVDNTNDVNQFIQHTQTLQEQIKEILSQNNKKQKIVDSSEDIQTIDEQSRESSLDLTNRNSISNFSERPNNQKENLQNLNYQPMISDRIQSTIEHNKQVRRDSKSSLNHNVSVNKKKELKKEPYEKNNLQLQYERALDLKYNKGMQKKQQQQTKLIEESYIQQQTENERMSPKHIYLKLSPRAKNNQIGVLQNFINPYPSGNSNNANSQKDELANFKRQINNLISKENEIKGFFTGSNSTTPSNIHSEQNVIDQQQNPIIKIQVHNTDGQLLQESTIPNNKNQQQENDLNVRQKPQQALSERITSSFKQFNQNNKQAQDNSLKLKQDSNRQKEDSFRQNEDNQVKPKQDAGLFDRLMKKNLQTDNNKKEKQMKRSCSAKQVVINTDINENSPRNKNSTKQSYSNKSTGSYSQQFSQTQPKKPCLKSNSQTKLQINQFNIQVQGNQQEQQVDKPLLITDLSVRSSPKQIQLENQKNSSNFMQSSQANQQIHQNQMQFAKQTNRLMNSNLLGTPTSANLSIYQNIQSTNSILTLRQQIENKILRNNKDNSSTPNLNSLINHNQNNDGNQDNNNSSNCNYNSKKVIALHNQMIHSDKPNRQEILEETNQVITKTNDNTIQRGRYPLPLPPQKNASQNQQQPSSNHQPEKRASSLPKKVSYESLVQSALMRQQVFKNSNELNNSQNDKNQDNSLNKSSKANNSQRDKSPSYQQQLSSSRNQLTNQSDTALVPKSIDRKKRTDSLQVRNSSSKVDQHSNNNNKTKQQTLLRQSSERAIKVNNNQNSISSQQTNNSSSLSYSLFYKPSSNTPGLMTHHLYNNTASESQFNQSKTINNPLKAFSYQHLDQIQQQEQKSLLEMDIIERNNAWLTQRKQKNEQRKKEQEQKEVEGCTFKPKLRSKSPLSYAQDREETRSMYSYSNTGQSEQNIQLLKQQQNDLYSSYFNKTPVMRVGGGGTKILTEGYSQQHQLNILRKSSLNSIGQQKIKQFFPQNLFINQNN